MSLVTLLALSTALATYVRPEHASSGEFLRIEGIELLYRDIESFNVSSIDSCQELCEHTYRCESFSYDGSIHHGTCMLKKSAKNYVHNPTMTSSVRCRRPFKCFANSNFHGYDFSTIQTSYNDCAFRCNKSAKKCNGFTWLNNENAALGQCYLKTLPADAMPVPDSRSAIGCQRIAEPDSKRADAACISFLCLGDVILFIGAFIAR
jgi:hypothetical protein